MQPYEQQRRERLASLVERARQEALADARRLQAELDKDHRALGVDLERYRQKKAEDPTLLDE